ncbi:NAD-dependent epimerase/dehydratase family protein [Streptomyces harbinensis]|uniref:NAD-dependent epimerase/dehydratase family protein n=1 Tax=Streptomyces harbinensis TaxID=1176198 RepID=UPI003722FA6A
MRVVIVGATGNVGSAVVRALAADPAVTSLTGLARRKPRWQADKTTWRQVDLRASDGDGPPLADLFRGADAVVHLAWLIQPTRDPAETWRTNVLGTARVLKAVAAARVPALVCASSVAAYSPGPTDRAVDESWPTHGCPTSAYSREKAYVERMLDTFEAEQRDIRVVRMRPGFLFSRASAAQQRRYFVGPLLFGPLARPELTPVVPDVAGLRFQVLHTDDAADAYRRALTRPVHGAFNLAADPVLDPAQLARIFRARRLKLPPAVLRAAVAGAWHGRLIPASPGLLDTLLRLPVMDCSRAHGELDWRPGRDAEEALRALVDGLRHNAGAPTPPLDPHPPGGRLREFATGVGQRP